MTDTTTQPKRKGRIPKGLKNNIERKVIECNKTLQHPTLQNIAEETGVCRQTVANILDKYKINQEDVEGYKANQASILLGLQHRITAKITDEDIEKASLKDKVIAASICLDKHRLVTGESTSNVASWTTVISKVQHTEVDITPS